MTKPVIISQGRSLGSSCPACGQMQDGWTGFSWDGKPAVPEPGDPTICNDCGVLLAFKNKDGDLRWPTLAECAEWAAAADVDQALKKIQRDITLRRASGLKQ